MKYPPEGCEILILPDRPCRKYIPNSFIVQLTLEKFEKMCFVFTQFFENFAWRDEILFHPAQRIPQRDEILFHPGKRLSWRDEIIFHPAERPGPEMITNSLPSSYTIKLLGIRILLISKFEFIDAIFVCFENLILRILKLEFNLR